MIKAFAAFEAGAELKPFEFDPGQLKANQVEIKVRYCGVCHSDLSVIDNAWGVSQYPIVPGHEVVGEVSQLGNQVKHLKLGQMVGLGWHSAYCYECSHCRSGDHNLCANSQATIVSHHGGFADKVRADAMSVVAIPEGIDLETAGPLFCGGVTVFNPLLQYAIKPTDKVAVIGIGGLGHLALQFLNAWGCEVTAFTSHPSKQKEAKRLGAHLTLDSRDQQQLTAAAGQFDLILSTVNVSLDWGLYLNTLNARGRLHLLGATLEPISVNAFTLMAGQRSLSGSQVGSPATIAKMLEFSKRHAIAPVIEKFAFNDVNKAIKKLRGGDVHYRIVLEH